MMTRIAFALSACLLAAACQGDDDDNVSGDDVATDDSSDDSSAGDGVLVAVEEEGETAAVVVDNAAEPAYVGGMFAGSAGASTGSSVGDVIAAVQANLQLLFTLPGCTVISNVVIDTGEAPSTFDVAFDSCTAPNGNLLLDGALHAEVAVTGDPLTLVYGLETDGLTIGNRTIAGAWEVRHVFGDAIVNTWTGDLTVTGPNGTLTSSTDASFVVDGLCVTYALDAEVITPSGRELSVHADEVTRCLDACAISGSVVVEGGVQGSLSWDYNGTGTVVATGSAGGSFELDLRCE